MRYILSVEVKLTEVNEPAESHHELEQGVDKIVNVATRLMQLPMQNLTPCGLELRKQVLLGDCHFETLTSVLSKYAQLTNDMEVQIP